MKIQTTARIETFAIDGTPQNLPDNQTIDLEFSAIDTGGGFKDPILDFSFVIPKDNLVHEVERQKSHVSVAVSDPAHDGNHSSFSCKGELQAVEEELFEINGRLKDEQLRKELIEFVFKLLR